MKKLYMIFFLVLTVLTGISNVSAQALVFEEGFNSSTLPVGWSQDGTGATWVTSSTYKSEGSYGARYPDTSGSLLAKKLITPEINLTTGNAPYKLSFYHQQAAYLGNNDSLRVYYRTSSTANWIRIASFRDVAASFVLKEVSLPNPTATYQIAFEGITNYKSGVNIDAVKIYDTPLCANSIGLNVSNVSQSSATLGWSLATEGALSTQFQLKVSTSVITNLTSGLGTIVSDSTVTTTNNTCVINKLAPNTKYYVYLRTNCSASSKGYSTWQSFEFTTPCSIVALPFTENFDAISSGIPSCWLSGGTNTTKPAVSTTYKSGSSGKSLYFTSGTGGDAYVVLPQITGVTNNIEILFKSYATSSNQRIQIFAMSDPYNLSTALPIGNYTLTSGSWQSFAINTNSLSVSTNNPYIAFYSPSGTSNAFYVDDINIRILPPCPRPDSLKVSDITDRSVKLSWQEKASAISWEIKLMRPGVDTVDIAASTNPFVLPGLLSNTSYEAIVKAACGTDYTINKISFKTRCSPFTIPFMESFEGTSSSILIPDCWDNADGTTTTSTYKWSYNSGGASGKGLAFNSVYNASGNTNFLKTPRFDLSDLALGTILKFKYKNTGASDFSIFVSTDGGKTYSETLATNIPKASSYTELEYYRPHSVNDTNVVFVFKGTSNYTSSYLYLDDVSVTEAPSCNKIRDLALSSIGITTADISWIDQGTATSWEFVRKSGTVKTTLILNTPSYQITGLLPNTEYKDTISLRAICAPGDTSDVETKTFIYKTKCEAITVFPYTYGFEDTSLDCWTSAHTEGTSTTLWAPGTTYFKSGNKSAYLNYQNSGNKVNLVTPLLQIPSADTHQVDFWFRRYSSDYYSGERLKVWINTSPDTIGATPLTIVGKSVSSIEGSVTKTPVEASGAGWYEYSAILPQGGNVYVIFEMIWKGGYAVAIDDVRIREIPNCFKPQAVSIDSISDNAVRVNIADTNNVAWDVEYGFAGFVHGSGTLTTINKDTTAISSLTASSAYDFYIRANCAGENSEWVGPITISTFCSPFVITPANPFFEGFESGYSQNNPVGDCWRQYSVVGDSIWRINSTKTDYSRIPYAGNFNATLRFGNTDWLFRNFHLEAGKLYNFSVYARQDGSTATNASLRVAYGSAASPSLMKTDIIAQTGLVTGNYQKLESEFSVPATGNYVIGILGTINSSPWYISMDNISLKEVSCVKPTSLVTTVLTDSSATINFSSTAEKWLLKVFKRSVNLDSLNVLAGTVKNNVEILSKPYNIDDLDANTVYYYYIKGICVDNSESDWVGNSFKTQCIPIDLPYVENFENNIASRFDCWSILSGTAAKSATYMYKGSLSARAIGATVVSPKLNIAGSFGGYQMNGFAYALADSTEISVGVIVNPNDVATYAPISTVIIPKKNTWTEFTAYFTDIDSPGYEDYTDAKNFVLSTAGDRTIYVDSLRFEQKPSCLKPTGISITAITSDSATFNWTSSTETQWHLKLEQGATVVKDTIVKSLPIRLGRFAPVTTYTYAVRSICTANDSSEWVKGSFTTICLPFVEVPFYENFEQSVPPACWTAAHTAGSSTTVWSKSSTYANSGAASAYLYYQSSGNKVDLATPKLRIPAANAYRLRFAIRRYSSTLYAGEGIKLWLNTNSPDTINAAPLALDVHGVSFIEGSVTRIPIESGGAGWYEYTAVIPVQGDVYVVFETIWKGGYALSLYLDDIRIEKIPSCIRPISVKAYDIKQETAMIAFNDTTNATTWELAIGKIGFNPDTLSTYITANNDTVPINGLNANTSYQVYVRTVCGSEKSSWTSQTTFKTLCGVYATPFSENFSGTTFPADCWSRYTGSFTNQSISINDLTLSTSGWTSTTTALEGAKHAKVNIYSGSLTAAWLLTPAIAISDANQELVFDIALTKWLGTGPITNPSTGQGDAAFAVVISQDGGNTWDKSEATIWNNTGSSRVFNQIPASGDNISISLAPYNNKTIKVAFYAEATGVNGTTDVDFHVGNVKIKTINPCARPIALKLDSANLMDLSAQVIIEHSPTDTGWQAVIGKKGFNPDTAVTIISSVNDTLLFSDLESITSYDVYVRTDCGNTSVSEWRKISFTTQCTSVVSITKDKSYIENFDKYGSGEGTFPSCWAKVKEYEYFDDWYYEYTYYPYLSTVYSASSPASLYMYNENIVAAPKFDKDINLLSVSFSARGVYALQVGVVSDLSDPTSFVAIESVTPTSSFARYTIDLKRYNGNGGNLAFRTTSSNYGLYLDSVVVSLAPTCYEPFDVAVSSVTDSSAVVTWKKAPDSKYFELRLSDGSSVDTINSVSDTLSLPNLAANTVYSVEVRSFCEDENLVKDTTAWSAVYTFRTAQNPASIPYSYGFEDASANAKWILENGTQGNKWIISTKDTTAVKEGATALYITNNDSINAYTVVGQTSTAWTYRSFNLEKGAYDVSFAWKANGQTTLDYLRAFLVPTSVTLKAGELSSVSSSATPSGWIAVDGGSKLNLSTIWKTQRSIAGIADAGYYNLVFLWRNDGSSGTQAPAAIDSIVIEKLNCAIPSDIAAYNIGADTASVRWTSLNEGVEYEIVYLRANLTFGLTNPGDTLVSSQRFAKLNALSPSTTYKAYVRAKCGEGIYSNWSDSIAFTTTQIPATLPYIHGFENGLENSNWTLINGTQANQWTIGNAVNNGGNTSLYISNDGGATHGYNETSSSIVWVYRTVHLIPGQYNVSFDWQCAGDEWYSTYYDYLLAFLTPASDIPVAGSLTVNGKSATATTAPTGWTFLGEGNQLLVDKTVWTSYRKKISITTAGNYNILFAWRNDGSLGYDPAAALDNISIKQITCVDLTGLVADSIQSDAARLRWKKTTASSYQVKLFTSTKTNSQISSAVAEREIQTNDSIVRFGGLASSSTYYAYVRAICGVNDSSEWSSVVSFKTLCAPVETPFGEDFEGTIFPNDCWSRYSGAFVDSVLTSTLTATTSGWSSITTNNGLQTKHPKVNVYSTNKYWLVTPAIKIQDANQTLGFNLALTSFGSANSPVSGKKRADDKFKVIISEDAGLTWRTSNAVVWDSIGSSGRVYGAIPSTGEYASIPLAAYNGKTIKVAFYIESASNGDADDDLHIDNVRINCYGGERIISDAVCTGGIYEGHGFTIPSTQVVPGEHVFRRVKPAATSIECDTAIVLNLKVNAKITVSIKDTICIGQVYNKYGFPDLTEAGSYVLDRISAAGCDSTVSLTLTALQVQSFKTDTICEGSNYPFGSKILTESGVYRDTLPNQIGCDSIVTLNLTVIPHSFIINKNLCESQTFTIGDTILTTTGVYTKRLTNRLGCDSIVTVDLTVYPTIEHLTESICYGGSYQFGDTILTTSGNYNRVYTNPGGCRSEQYITLTVLDRDTVDISDYVCAGSVYYEHGHIEGLVAYNDTILYETLTSSLRCDSINRIYLQVIQPVKDTAYVRIQDGDHYNWEGNTYTEAGLYGPKTIPSVLGCDSIVWLNLDIETSVYSLSIRPFTVSPNPVRTNEYIYVNHDFTETEKNGLKVEVINSIGQIIRNYIPDVYPLCINGINMPGYYVIRVKTGEGAIYRGNIIVK